jgi:hypothetical protein
MELLKPTIVTDGGPWADHNMPCAVCHVNHAVLNLDGYAFEPCWTCQIKGWKLTLDVKKWWKLWN